MKTSSWHVLSDEGTLFGDWVQSAAHELDNPGTLELAARTKGHVQCHNYLSGERIQLHEVKEELSRLAIPTINIQ